MDPTILRDLRALARGGLTTKQIYKKLLTMGHELDLETCRRMIRRNSINVRRRGEWETTRTPPDPLTLPDSHWHKHAVRMMIDGVPYKKIAEALGRGFAGVRKVRERYSFWIAPQLARKAAARALELEIASHKAEVKSANPPPVYKGPME